MFPWGIEAKLNELESESDTTAQNGLESAKFLIPVPQGQKGLLIWIFY